MQTRLAHQDSVLKTEACLDEPQADLLVPLDDDTLGLVSGGVQLPNPTW